MNPTAERLWLDAHSDILDRSHLFRPDQLADEQRALQPVPQHHQAAPEPIGLDGSLPGRVFCLVETMPATNSSGWWVPMVNGTDRLGVIEFTFADGVDVHDDITPPRWRPPSNRRPVRRRARR